MGKRLYVILQVSSILMVLCLSECKKDHTKNDLVPAPDWAVGNWIFKTYVSINLLIGGSEYDSIYYFGNIILNNDGTGLQIQFAPGNSVEVKFSSQENFEIVDNPVRDGGQGNFQGTDKLYLNVNYFTQQVQSSYNVQGTKFSNDKIFLGAPTARTLPAGFITKDSVTINAIVCANFSPTQVFFDYGTPTTYGKSILATSSNLTGFSLNSITVILSGIDMSQKNHFRVRAENSAGTALGNDMTFWVPPLVTDFDGNVYQCVAINDQIWMAENLRTTKFNDGTSIPDVKDSIIWSELTTPAYCWSKNDSLTYRQPYGALYNLSAVKSGSLCPTGWHIPKLDEWQKMIDFLGGERKAVYKLEEKGTAHWSVSNGGGSNESGFTAVESFIRDTSGVFTWGPKWWSFTGVEMNTWECEGIIITISPEQLNGKSGLSVRCIKD